MKTLITKVLNTRPEDAPSVKLMLYLGFFIGIFLATYDVAAPAIFLNYFNDENILAQAFLVSGFIGVVGTFLYVYSLARDKNEIYILLSGSLNTISGTKKINSPGDTNVIGCIFSDGDNDIMTAETNADSILFALPLNDMFDILTNYPHLIKQFITRVSQKYSESQLST